MNKATLLLTLLAGFLGARVTAENAVTITANGKAPEATTYQIRNAKYHELLRPKDANSANGTPIVLYPAQPWKCMTWRLQPAGEASFHLKNLFTSKTIYAGSDTNAPQQSVAQEPLAKAGGESPTWRFLQLADGSFEIVDAQSGNALTAAKEDDGYSFKIVTAPWQKLDEQKWILEKIDPSNLTM